ncbi:hypothetical protein JMJ77_0009336 [Colletotrichum scovillei]|uniref:Uncharacterized protein n=1 Tax=Colletotrichum scovillei TaxID=1209932 RepID=A0A9P7U7R1_9PEZI|nr:hypothetical protein JMJ77_0009336 [Colletotrichum scovillei]KAG7052414.1 hypothetical protein JMJ78_0005432 [Colletotrichum scovillei]KAG7064706.1 hypothetical protein JMJ76_0012466 [Colletotrichum scovillei]
MQKSPGKSPKKPDIGHLICHETFERHRHLGANSVGSELSLVRLGTIPPHLSLHYLYLYYDADANH